MDRKKSYLLFAFALLSLITTPSFAQQQVNLTTYYPAPFGAYDRIRLVPRDPNTIICNVSSLGTMFVDQTDNSLKTCTQVAGSPTWTASTLWTQEGDNLFPADFSNNNLRIGIGTSNPPFKLSIDTDSANPDGGILARGDDNGAGTALGNIGHGSWFMWYPKKGAFRAGVISANQWDDVNIGNYSSAMGADTIAKGQYSVALGQGAVANGISSFATGFQSTANGNMSTAMGNMATAGGIASFSMGSQTNATGNYSTATGFSTIAGPGNYNFSMGSTTTASGLAAVSMGQGTLSSGFGTTSMGSGTVADSMSSLVIGQYNVISGGNPSSWISSEPVFVIGNGSDPSSRANALTVLKNGNMGINTISPPFKLSIDMNAATPDGGIISKGTYQSGADLADPTPRLPYLIWYPKKAAFRAGITYGGQWNDSRIGNFSTAMGVDTTASGDWSTALGSGTTASGTMGATAMGTGTVASGGWAPIAMGMQTTASGNTSTAMGMSTVASGPYSTTMGFFSTATGQMSLTAGIYTTAQAFSSVVVGRCNVISGTSNNWIPTDPLFVIGNGAKNLGIGACTSFNNALTVLKNGNVGIGISAPTQTLDMVGAMRMEPQSSPPAACSAAVAGSLYVDTDNNTLCYCNGAAWSGVAGGGICS